MASQTITATETLVSSAARTSSGNAVLSGDYYAAEHLRVTLDVTAVSGTTPSLTLAVEKSADGTTWTAADTFPARTTTGAVTRDIYGGGFNRLRVSWTITGTTPSFTFSVTAGVDRRRFIPRGRRRR